ncbi:hypothetical protein [Psychrobacillus lasiicapitis]|uniref:Uncharacterized protein n=1 Tax=Psychrobacillus lasiicapitis TaxID=1636719 RepID=A0A544TEU4_9BACI|nr:hypothetical protein [Psychrobacillus lasiicapitis]TQR15978.1 hypothetical protein FG382_04485 [Psychrobacillus lasiicapitis]GGA16644.1 hypothetical protein GCM10011384_01930 [Psychrobacillus lasiicapitis]
MSFKIGIIICLIIMVFIAGVTFYLGKKVAHSLMKYIPVFSFASGVIFYYSKLHFISYKPNSFDGIYDMILFIILIIVGSIALIETLIVDIVKNSELFGKSYTALRKAITLDNIKKVFKFKVPSSILRKIRS